MGRIDQIYCTHCTPETSVFGRFTGFSARAGSLEPEALRDAYDSAFRALSTYQLPDRMPPEEIVRADADSAPARLVFQPLAGGFQVIGHVAYRPVQADGAGGVGNYFGHFAFAGRRGDADDWTALDALRLWGARGWIRRDSPDIPPRIPPLDRLDALLGGLEPTLDEDVFRSFLTTPPLGPFHDPAGVIPGRWRSAPCAERRALFEALLAGYLETQPRRQGALMLVAEPSLAALLFFGLARAVPVHLSDGAIGFSTYEGGRPQTPLASTVFGGPVQAATDSAACREADFVLDTFASPSAAQTRPGRGDSRGEFARRACQLLCGSGGWAALDRMLADFREAGARHPGDLDEFARAHAVLEGLFEPGARTLPSLAPAGSPADRYAVAAARQRILAQGVDLPSLAESPAAVILIELLTRGGPDPALAPTLDALVSGLPASGVVALLGRRDIPLRNRVLALLAHVGREGRFPADLESAIHDATVQKTARPDPMLSDVLPHVLDRLKPEWLPSLTARVPAVAKAGFVSAMAARFANQPDARATIRGLIEGLSDDDLCRVISAEHSSIVTLYRQDPAWLRDKVDDLLRGLPYRPRQFVIRLDALGKLAASLRPDQSSQVQAWEAVRRALDRSHGTIRRPKPESRRPGILSAFAKKPSGPTASDPACELADAIIAAMPDVTDTKRLCDCLCELIDKGPFPQGGSRTPTRDAIARAINARSRT